MTRWMFLLVFSWMGFAQADPLAHIQTWTKDQISFPDTSDRSEFTRFQNFLRYNPRPERAADLGHWLSKFHQALPNAQWGFSLKTLPPEFDGLLEVPEGFAPSEAFFSRLYLREVEAAIVGLRNTDLGLVPSLVTAVFNTPVHSCVVEDLTRVVGGLLQDDRTMLATLRAMVNDSWLLANSEQVREMVSLFRYSDNPELFFTSLEARISVLSQDATTIAQLGAEPKRIADAIKNLQKLSDWDRRGVETAYRFFTRMLQWHSHLLSPTEQEWTKETVTRLDQYLTVRPSTFDMLCERKLADEPRSPLTFSLSNSIAHEGRQPKS